MGRSKGRHRVGGHPGVGDQHVDVTECRGATSHTAIIARQLGIPCVVGVVGAILVESGRAAQTPQDVRDVLAREDV